MANTEHISEDTYRDKKIDLPADAGLGPLMPAYELVEQWCKAGARFAGHDFRMRSLQAIKELVQQRQDSELARFMPMSIPWNDYRYSGAEVRGFTDLGDGAYLTDLAGFLERSGAELLATLLKSESPIQLLAAAVCRSAQVLHIPKNVHNKHIELCNVVGNEELSAEVLFLIVEEGARITLHDMQRATNGIKVCVLRGFIGAHARVTVINDQSYESDFYGISSEVWSLSKGSHLTTVSGLTGGKQILGSERFYIRRSVGSYRAYFTCGFKRE